MKRTYRQSTVGPDDRAAQLAAGVEPVTARDREIVRGLERDAVQALEQVMAEQEDPSDG